MTDRPIPFFGPMVRALLDGRKTQTRRVLDPQPKVLRNGIWYRPYPMLRPQHWAYLHGDLVSGYTKARYAPGDRLWVREAWRAMDGQDKFSGAQIGAQCVDAGYRTAWSPLHYEADGARANWIADPRTFGTKPGRYRHARFMPRWASRLTLIVTDVRVQRLQDIRNEDCISEGIAIHPNSNAPRTGPVQDQFAKDHGLISHYGAQFRTLWDGLNADRAPWAANPWVCALTFTVHRSNIDQMAQEAAAHAV